MTDSSAQQTQSPRPARDVLQKARHAALAAQDFAEARRVELAAIAAFPDDAILHHQSAWTLGKLGDFALARAHEERAVRLAPERPEYLKSLSAILAKLGRHGEAQAALQQSQEAAERAAAEEAAADARMRQEAAARVSALIGHALASPWPHAADRDAAAKHQTLLMNTPWDASARWILRVGPERAEGEIVAFPGIGRFYVGPPHQVLHKRLARGVAWELTVGVLLMELASRLDPGALIIDVGANVGVHTIGAAGVFGGHVLAFEPLEETFARLTANIALNGLTNVTAIMKACGAQSGRGEMIGMREENPGEARVSVNADGATEITTIDEACALAGKPAGLIKIDVEGHETSVLEGARGVLERDRPLVVCELLSSNAPAIQAAFRKFGYRGEKLHQSDWLFLPDGDPAATRRETFTRIFAENRWQSDQSASGTGSTQRATAELIPQLQELYGALGIESVADAPCGDFNWAEPLARGLKSYKGFDIVASVVAIAAERASHLPHCSFATADICEEVLPACDLILCRDCLVHLPFDLIARALCNMRASGATWLLTTTFPDLAANADVETGRWRPLNLQAAPFNLPPPERLIIERPSLAPHPDRGHKSLGLWRLSDLPA